MQERLQVCFEIFPAHYTVGFEDGVASAALDGEILSNCETEEDIPELVNMDGVRAGVLVKNVIKFRDDGVPPHYLIPLGTLIVSFIINTYRHHQYI